MFNFWRQSKKQSGFSLLEVVLYVGLASIIISVIGYSIHGILQIRVKSQTITEVEQQGVSAVQKISQKIRNAQDVVNLVSTSTIQDIKTQRGIADVGNSGGTHTSPANFEEFDSMTSAFVLNSNNRHMSSGFTSSAANMEVDDISGAIALTGTDTINFYRDSGSNSATTRFHWESWEYVGAPGGDNEFIVRGRYQITINAGTRTGTDTVTACSDRDKCIPFITGIMNSDSSDDADEATALAWMSADNTVSVERGGNTDVTTVYGVVVEFTGSNWSVGHGRTGDVTGDTGTIDLFEESVGTSGGIGPTLTTYNVGDWSNAIIFHQFKADDTSNNQAIADTSAVYIPGGRPNEVDWSFQSDHDGNDNQHMVHILENANMTVTRFSSTGSAEGDNNISISSAGIADLSNAAVVGSSNSSGGGTAYGRGWKGYYFTSLGNVSAWAHRSGNTIDTRIQVIDFPVTEEQVIGTVTTTTSDIVIQRGLADVPNTGGSHTAPTDFEAFDSMTSAFVLNGSTRHANSGEPGYNSTLYMDDLSGAVVLSNTSTIDFYRQSGSKASDMRFNWESWEYIGSAGGANEFIVRGRYQITINAGSRTGSDTVDFCDNRVKCIPFITGMMTNNTGNDSNSFTALAWMSANNEVSVERGGNTSDLTVYGVVVEFTGSNWSVGHGRTGDVTGDTGTINLYQKSVGDSGDAFLVDDWSNAVIFHQFKGDDTVANEALTDTSPTYYPGTNLDEVDWYFSSDHDANDNQHMVHVLSNPDMSVSRYLNTGSLQNDNYTIIPTVNTSMTAVVGSANSSGTGTAFGRGFKGVYLSSESSVNAWAHRSGNTLQTRIQVLEMPGSEWIHKIQLIDSNGETIGFGLSEEGSIFVKEDGIYEFLTSDKVVASNLYFNNYSLASTTGILSFGFDLKYNSDSPRNELNYDETFRGSANVLNK